MMDIMANAVNWVIIHLAFLIAVLVVAATTVLLIAIPIGAHLALVFASFFLPLTIAVWPLNKDWALGCINVMMGSVATTIAVAACAKMFLGSGGALAKAGIAATAALEAGDKGLVLGAAIGMIVVALVVALTAKSISGIVSSIFSSASLSITGRGAGKAAAGAASGAGAGAVKAMNALSAGLAKLAGAMK